MIEWLRNYALAAHEYWSTQGNRPLPHPVNLSRLPGERAVKVVRLKALLPSCPTVRLAPDSVGRWISARQTPRIGRTKKNFYDFKGSPPPCHAIV
ncbi:hypothetical protein ACCO45_012097 [Purpureocillium lilacinum]|uniref:Uncharacterized protein n=1 Tax=Purpureocillium lilacinum TaxID=33203 RepID=A0ACC4DD05_PURLI